MKLYGVKISNYYNVVKAALLEKAIPFEEIETPPSQNKELLEKSPMGKIPFIGTDHGYFSESTAILAYLESIKPEPSLYPKDPGLAGRAQQIHAMIDCYIDPPARKLLGPAFFGQPAEEALIDQVHAQVVRGIQGLERVVAFNPYVAGKHFTHADIAAVLTIPLAKAVLEILGRPNPLSSFKGFEDYYGKMSERPSFKKVMEERDASIKALMDKAE